MAESNKLLSNDWIRGLIVGVVVAAIGVVLLLTNALQGPEQTTWDVRVRQFAKPSSATNDVVVVHVDQSDLDLLQADFGLGWPWPRSIYSTIIDFAAAANAASVTFDIILEDEGSGGFFDDQIMADSAELFGRSVYGAELLVDAFQNESLPEDERAQPELWPAGIQLPGIQVDHGGQDADDVSLSFLGGTFPYEEVIPGNATLAFVNQQNDDDGVFRRYRLVNYHLEQPVPALALGPVVAGSSSAVDLSFDRRGITLDGDLVVPLDPGGKVLLKYTVPWAKPTAADLERDPAERNSFYARELIFSGANIQAGMEPPVDPESFEGRHILVGLSASGLLDLRPTPLDARAPGVIVHATMLDNLLSGEFMRDASVWGSILLIIGLSILAAVLASVVEKSYLEAIVIVVFLVLPFGIAVLGFQQDVWIPLVVPLVTVVLALAGANVANYSTTGAEKREIQDIFGRYLAPAVVSSLVEDRANLKMGGEEREISIFFSDIQKFSVISKKLRPTELSEFLLRYLTPLTNIIVADEFGLIDKYEGDAIIAMWNAPTDLENHPEHALRSAMNCQAALAELRPAFREQLDTDVYQRIGMNLGRATVGNFGSEMRRDYTMIGDAVNLAARLEGANKAFGTYTMIADVLHDRTKGLYPVRELGYIAVVGREDIGVRIYEPMEPEQHEKMSKVLRVYEEGRQYFYDEQFDKAIKYFEKAAPYDPVSQSYIARCETFMEAPPVDWNGIWVLTEKG